MYANNAGTGYTNANIFYLFLGAQQQWGINTGGAVRTSTLPIPFTNVFLAVASTSSEWCCPGCSATNTTVTTRAYQSNRPDVAQPNDVNWIIIGCQPQWGFTVFDPAYYKNVNFTLPLSVNGTFCAFSTGYDAKGSTFLWHSMSHFNNVNVGVTGFVFDSRYTFTGLGYLAVCWQKQWGYYTAAVGAIYTDVTTPVSFSRCFLAASIDILLAVSTTWPGTTQTVWNINASTANKLRFIWAKAPIELDGAVWFGIFIQTVGI